MKDDHNVRRYEHRLEDRPVVFGTFMALARTAANCENRSLGRIQNTWREAWR